MIIFLQIVILIMSAVVHEFAHGYVAYLLGDDTAKNQGRLTLNPIKHLDLFGSIFLPLILIISQSSFFLAWAKPVPYDPRNIKDKRFGELKVSLAGPASNFIIALVFGLLARYLYYQLSASLNFSGSLVNSIFLLSVIICQINLILMIFNLIPIPPLDGSKVFLVFLPDRLKYYFYRFEQYGLFLLLVLIAGGFFGFLIKLVDLFFYLIAGF